MLIFNAKFNEEVARILDKILSFPVMFLVLTETGWDSDKGYCL